MTNEHSTLWSGAMTNEQTHKFTRADVGCYLEGAHGWHNIYRVVELAQAAGWKLSDEDAVIVDAYRNSEATDAQADAMTMQGGVADDATDYLQSVTEPGLFWVWDTGELSLISDEDED